MAVDNLNFIGINRAISDYASAGACEELINLRPTTGGLVPVKPFAVKMGSVTYDKVYEHKVGSGTNYIAVSWTAPYLSVYRLTDSEPVLIGKFTFTNYQTFPFDCLHFAYTGNIVLLSVADKENGIYDSKSFIWKDDEYVESEAGIPGINIELIAGTPQLFEAPAQATYTRDSSGEEIRTQLSAGLNAIQQENKGYCFGTILIAIAYKTKDGKTFWTNRWIPYDPTVVINTDASLRSSYYVMDKTTYESQHPWLFTKSDYVYRTRDPQDKIVMAGLPLTLRLSGAINWDETTSFLDSLEIYVSKPAIFPDVTSQIMTPDSALTVTWLDPTPYSDMNLGGQLLYLQRSVSIQDIKSATQSSSHVDVALNFGGNLQMTDKTLEVDAGAVTRYGDILAYNARFHYFDSVSRTEIKDIGFHFNTGTTVLTHYVFVVFNDGQKDRLIYVGTQQLISNVFADIVIAPSLRVKQVITWDVNGYCVWYGMTGSSTYNCSIGSADSVIKTGSATDEMVDARSNTPASLRGVAFIEEPDAINVTEQYNPFVFNVRNSYLAPGKVLDVKPQMVAVLDVSYGDYPLNVFTNRGLYALLQGSGDVLYGNFRSISNLVTTSNSISTENGTFFIAAGGLWAVAGATAVLVSDALSLGPHKFIRNCYQFAQLYGLYAQLSLLSQVPFEDYVNGASLSYNRFRDELMVSNPSYGYTYVLSLKYRQWFKMAITLSQDTVGGDMAKVSVTGGAYNLVDLSDEMETSAKVRGAAGSSVNVLTADTQIGFTFTVGGVSYTLEYTLTAEDYTDPRANLQGNLQAYWNEQMAGTPLADTSISIIFDQPYGAVSYRFLFPEGYSEPADFAGEFFRKYQGQETERSSFFFSQAPGAYISVATVHLQSRPFSISYQYIHVHRIVSMIRGELSSVSHKIIVSLYGSDNLQTWTLLSYSDRQGTSGASLKFSQVRTPSAARSWRYYTVCIGGKVPTDTDFGTVMFDYQPVVRRIG